MNRKLAIAVPVLAAVLLGVLPAATPISNAATSVLAAGPTSTAAWPSNTPISAETGAPVGDAGTGVDPLVPAGTDPQVPVTLGYVNRNHDEGYTTNGQVDVPF